MTTAATMEQWTIREKLSLASSVLRSGDQNWVSVSRAIKPFVEPHRPSDWVSQKNCAIQYSAMLEAVDTPKRKRSGEKGEVETPVDLVVRRMTQERIEELRHQISDDRRRFRQLQEEIQAIQAGQRDDQLPRLWQEIQEKKKQEEEAEESRRLLAEAKAAAAAAKIKTALPSPNKRRPPVRPPKVPPKPQAAAPTSEVEESIPDTEPVVSVESTEPVAIVTGSEDVQVDEDDQSQPALLSLLSQEEKAKDAGKDAKDAEGPVTIDEFTHIFSDSTKESPGKETTEEKQKQSASARLKESGTPQDKDRPDAPMEDSIIDESELNITEEKKEEVQKTSEEEKQGNAEKSTKDSVPEISVEKAEPDVRKVETGGGKLLRSTHHEPIDMEPSSPGVQKTEKKRGRGRPSNASRKSARMKSKPEEEDEDTVMSFDDLKDETRSDAADSEDHDRPSESDDASFANIPSSSLFSDSLPNSPSSVSHSDEDHAYRLWRKAIMLVWRAAASHKYASIFMHPVTDDIAPGYGSIVHQPMDLVSIKRRVESGAIRTTEAFHRNLLLMFQNAIMYNSSDHDVHDMAVSMQNDVISQIEEFISTQLMVQQPDSSKMLRGRDATARRSDVTAKDDEGKVRRNSTDHPETSGKKRRTRADEY